MMKTQAEIFKLEKEIPRYIAQSNNGKARKSKWKRTLILLLLLVEVGLGLYFYFLHQPSYFASYPKIVDKLYYLLIIVPVMYVKISIFYSFL